MDGEKALVVPDILCIDRIESAFAKGKIMYGIEQVGLPGTVIADKAIDLVGKMKAGFFVIFEITDR
jgi:hypothetical protein